MTEAKARLSALIAAAGRGEEVVITRWGRPVARLVAIRNPRLKSAAGAGGDMRGDDRDIINVPRAPARKEG